MALYNRTDGDDEIKLIIAKAAMSVPLPSLKPNEGPPTTRGEQMHLMVENVKAQHDQIRKNILGQCPKAIPQSALADLRMKNFYSQRKTENFVKVGQSILDLLHEPISRPEAKPKFALLPVIPGQAYDKPLPTTQDYEMQPFLYELMPIMRALDTFNIQATSQLRMVNEEKEKLESDGSSKIPLVAVRKRSASDAKLDKVDERRPTKRSVSYAKAVERPFMKRVVSIAQAEEVMSAKRRENGTKLEHSSPRQTLDLPDRSGSPNAASIGDPGANNRDSRPIIEHRSSEVSSFSPTNGEFLSHKHSSTNGGVSSLPTNGEPLSHKHSSANGGVSSLPTNRNLHPSREKMASFALPKLNRDPRPSSRDPRLINRKFSIYDR